MSFIKRNRSTASSVIFSVIRRIRPRRRQAERYPCVGVEPPELAARCQSLVHIIFSLIKPFHERCRLVVSVAPKIIEQRPYQVAPSLNLLLVEYSRGGTVDLRVGIDLHAGSNRDSERFPRRQIRNGILGDSSSLRRTALSTLLSHELRCRTPRSEKMLGYRIDRPTNLRKPPQELLQHRSPSAWLWRVRFRRVGGHPCFH